MPQHAVFAQMVENGWEQPIVRSFSHGVSEVLNAFTNFSEIVVANPYNTSLKEVSTDLVDPTNGTPYFLVPMLSVISKMFAESLNHAAAFVSSEYGNPLSAVDHIGELTESFERARSAVLEQVNRWSFYTSPCRNHWTAVPKVHQLFRDAIRECTEYDGMTDNQLLLLSPTRGNTRYTYEDKSNICQFAKNLKP